MTTQPNTPTSQNTAAKRRLRWKMVLTLPVIMACTTLTAVEPAASQPSPTWDQVDVSTYSTQSKDRTEFNREVRKIIEKLAAELEK